MGALLGLRYSFHCGCSAGRITDLPGTQLHFLKPRPPLCNCTEAKWNRNSSLRPQDICRGAATTLGCLFSALFQCEESESLLGLTVASEMCRLRSIALRMYVLCRMYVCAMYDVCVCYGEPQSYHISPSPPGAYCFTGQTPNEESQTELLRNYNLYDRVITTEEIKLTKERWWSKKVVVVVGGGAQVIWGLCFETEHARLAG